MVKIDDVPIEKGRIPLDQLAELMDAMGGKILLIATSEEMVDATKDKTGGLKINFWTGANFKSKYDINSKTIVNPAIIYEEGLQVTQKYSKIAGGELVKRLQELGKDDTVALQEKFFEYRLFTQRTGYPRLVPVEESDKPKETLPTETEKPSKKNKKNQ